MRWMKCYRQESIVGLRDRHYVVPDPHCLDSGPFVHLSEMIVDNEEPFFNKQDTVYDKPDLIFGVSFPIFYKPFPRNRKRCPNV